MNLFLFANRMKIFWMTSEKTILIIVEIISAERSTTANCGLTLTMDAEWLFMMISSLCSCDLVVLCTMENCEEWHVYIRIATQEKYYIWVSDLQISLNDLCVWRKNKHKYWNVGVSFLNVVSFFFNAKNSIEEKIRVFLFFFLKSSICFCV